MKITHLTILAILMLFLSFNIAAEYEGEVTQSQNNVFELDGKTYEIDLNFVDGGADFEINSSGTKYGNPLPNSNEHTTGLQVGDKFTSHGITIEVQELDHGTSSRDASMYFRAYSENEVKRLYRDEHRQFHQNGETYPFILKYTDGGASVKLGENETELGEELVEGDRYSFNDFKIEVEDYGYRSEDDVQEDYIDFRVISNSPNTCEYYISGNINVENQISPTIEIIKDTEQLSSTEPEDSFYNVGFETGCGSEIQIIHRDEGDKIVEKNIDLPNEPYQLEEDIAIKSNNSFQITTEKPYEVDEEVNIEMNANKEVSSAGYVLDIRGPDPSQHEFGNRVSSHQFVPPEPGDYIIEMKPKEGWLSSIIGRVLGRENFDTETITVISNEEEWKTYCREQDYDPDQGSQMIKCVRSEVVPNYFEDSVGENPEVASSLCQDLLGMTYNKQEYRCS